MKTIQISTAKTGTIYQPHWNRLITAGRAHEGMYAPWREQLIQVQREIGFEYIRFHGIFNDEMMVYREDESGNAQYNWQYVDSLFDFLLGIGLRPILELGFTPTAMRSGEQTIFWWKGNVTPPADLKKWEALVSELVRHCIRRYGRSEIQKWYFEVWNEANISPFWSGTQQDYFTLYESTALAIKKVEKSLRVGGPATSSSDTVESPWIKDFLAFCEEKNLPLDFVSTHPYPNSYPLYSYGRPCYKDENGTYDSLVWLKKAVENTRYHDVEIHITEWNSSPNCRDLVHDTAFMAPFIVQNYIKTIGLADSIGFWTFTDIFEEESLGQSVFHGGFGMLNIQGLKKPSYHGFWFLSRLGNELLERTDSYVVTRKENRIQVLMWNYCHYNDVYANGDPTCISQLDRYSAFTEKGDELIQIHFDKPEEKFRMIQYTFDRAHGSVYDSWLENGTPEPPDEEELQILRTKSDLEAHISYLDGADDICIRLKPHGVTLLEFTPIK